MNFGKPPFMQTLRGSDDQRSIFFGCCHVVPSELGFHRHRLQRTDISPFRTRWERYRHIGREPTRAGQQFYGSFVSYSETKVHYQGNLFANQSAT